MKHSVNLLAGSDAGAGENPLHIREHGFGDPIGFCLGITSAVPDERGPEVLEHVAQHERLGLEVGDVVHADSLRAGLDNRTIAGPQPFGEAGR